MTLSPSEALTSINFDACCVLDHIASMIDPATTLGVLVELDAVKMALESLHLAARRQAAAGVH
jgi:hypothetical protein